MVQRKDNLYATNANAFYNMFLGKGFICLSYPMYQGSFDFPSYEHQFD